MRQKTTIALGWRLFGAVIGLGLQTVCEIWNRKLIRGQWGEGTNVAVCPGKLDLWRATLGVLRDSDLCSGDG